MEIALLIVIALAGLTSCITLVFLLLTLQDQIAKFTPPERISPPWPIIPESVRVDRVPAVQRKPRAPRKPKAPPPAEPEAPAVDTQTLTLPGVSDNGKKPTL